VSLDPERIADLLRRLPRELPIDLLAGEIVKETPGGLQMRQAIVLALNGDQTARIQRTESGVVIDRARMIAVGVEAGDTVWNIYREPDPGIILGGSSAFESPEEEAALIVRKNSGIEVGPRRRANLIEGSNVTLTVTDDPTDNEIDITLAATGGTGGGECGVFGDGSDGNVTISSPTTLVRDMFYDALTVSSTLDPGGFRIYCKTSCTINVGGAIRRDGATATDSNPTAGLAAGTLGGSSGGGNQVNLPSPTSNSLGGNGGTGGGYDVSNPDQPGGTASPPPATSGTARGLPQSSLGLLLPTGSRIEGGAGGAGGNGEAPFSVGSGAGAGGGVVLVCAKTLTNNGAISATGGNGRSANPGEHAGGGGGGGGGVVFLVYGTKTGSGTATASGGTGGTANFGTAKPGGNGSPGAVRELQTC
jgi:hypothetical protein